MEKIDLQSELNSSVGNNKTLVTGSNSLNVHFFDTNHNYTINDGIVTKVADGDAQEELNIGDVITNYTSNTALPSGVNWIYFGSDGTNQYLTTSIPISKAYTFKGTAIEWLTFEDTNSDINTVCATYIGSGATEARSITLADINRVTGFSEPNFATTQTYQFRSGNNNYENKQVNYYYPSSTADGYWQEPTGTPKSFIRNSYRYGTFDFESVHYIGPDDSYEELNGINLDNLKIIVGENMDFEYIIAAHTLTFNQMGGDDAEFSVAGVEQGEIKGDRYCVCFSNSSGGNNWGMTYSSNIRPVVVIPVGIKLNKQ